MNYGFVTVKVKNMEESLRFYTEFLGLSVARKFSPGPGINIAFLSDEKGSQIELIENVYEKVKEGTSIISIGFTVDNLDKVVELVNEKGIKIIRSSLDNSHGPKLFFIEDPNGAEIEFIEKFSAFK